MRKPAYNKWTISFHWVTELNKRNANCEECVLQLCYNFINCQSGTQLKRLLGRGLGSRLVNCCTLSLLRTRQVGNAKVRGVNLKYKIHQVTFSTNQLAAGASGSPASRWRRARSSRRSPGPRERRDQARPEIRKGSNI